MFRVFYPRVNHTTTFVINIKKYDEFIDFPINKNIYPGIYPLIPVRHVFISVDLSAGRDENPASAEFSRISVDYLKIKLIFIVFLSL